MNTAIAPTHRKPDSASTGWTDLFLEASDLIEKHVKCNCAFLNGHEPHCATVKAHEWRERYHKLAATPSSGGEEWTVERESDKHEYGFLYFTSKKTLGPRVWIRFALGWEIARAHNATLQPQLPKEDYDNLVRDAMLWRHQNANPPPQDDMKRLLLNLKSRLQQHIPWYRDSQRLNDDEWWVTDFTKEQVEGNIRECVRMIDAAM